MPGDPLAKPEEVLQRLYGYVAYRIGSGPNAEDIVSETIERALRYRDSYDERKGSPTAWLATIASHLIADQARASRAAQQIEPELRHAAEDFTERTVRELDLHEAMAFLDDRSRELLALRYGADLRAQDIARLLGQRTNTIEVALHRAISRLREILDHRPPASGTVHNDRTRQAAPGRSSRAK